MTAFKTCRSKWKTFSRCKGKQRGCTEYLGKGLARLNQPYEYAITGYIEVTSVLG